jgi:hypothetical protein
LTYQFNNRFRALILAGIILRLVILLLPFDVLFSRWGSDDLYYYSQIAGRFSETHFFTFDGTEPTNGFQPFFMFLLIPFGGAMLNDVQSSLRIILGIASILTIVTAFQIPKLFKDYGLNSQFALIASGLFLLHPKILSVTFNGTEAALSFLMIILSLRALQWIKEGKRLFLSTLIFCGLILTRMDFSILLFLLFITGLAQRNSLIDWVKVLVLPKILFGTWLAINYYYFDCIIPSSGASKSLHSTVLDINYFRLWLSTYSTAMMSESKLSITILAICALGSLYAFKQKAFQYKRHVFYMFGLSAICGLIPILSIGFFRDWYLILHFLLILFLSSLGIHFILQKTKYKVAIYLLIIVGLWTEAQYSQRKFNGSQVVEACLQFEQKIPKEVNVGSFNAGIVNCVLDNHTVINLDGVVNSTILEYFVNKNIQSYFKRYDIRYIIDNKSSIEYFLNNYSDQQKWVIVDQFRTDTQEWVLVSLL